MKPGSCGQIFFSYSTVECIVSWLIRSLAPFRLLSLSLSQTHTCTRSTYAHRVPCSQLTLPQRHLSLGKARWWMQVGGWYACAHFCVHPGVRTGSIRGEWRESITHGAVFVCLCILFHFFFLRIVLPCLASISCTLPCRLPHVAMFHTFAEEMLSAVLGSRPSCFVLSPYQCKWLTVGRGAKLLSVRSRG